MILGWTCRGESDSTLLGISYEIWSDPALSGYEVCVVVTARAARTSHFGQAKQLHKPLKENDRPWSRILNDRLDHADPDVIFLGKAQTRVGDGHVGRRWLLVFHTPTNQTAPASQSIASSTL